MLETFSVELPPFETRRDRPQHRAPDRPATAGELPPGIDIQYQWRITEADGDVVETPEQTLSWFDDRYDWTPLSGPNVTVYTYGADPAFQQAILDSAERTIASLAESYGATLEQPVRIWAYAAKEDLYGALAPNSEPWIAGAAYPPLSMIMAVLPPGTTTRWRGSSRTKSVIRCSSGHQESFQHPAALAGRGVGGRTGRRAAATASTPMPWSSRPPAKCPPLRTLNGPSLPYDRDGATGLPTPLA